MGGRVAGGQSGRRQSGRKQEGKHDVCSPLRLYSLTLEELSEELDRRTRETQRLQEEVEKATKLVLERVGCTYSINSNTPGPSCSMPRLHEDDSPGDSDVQSAQNQPVVQPLTYSLGGLSLEAASLPGKEVLENAIDDFSQQVSDLQKQLSEFGRIWFGRYVYDGCPQVTNTKLQTKLHEVQMERDVLSDLRMKDSRKHVSQMEKMLCMLEELQSTKRSGDPKLQGTQEEATSLSRRVETIEQTIKEVYPTSMSHEKRCGNNSVTRADAATGPRQPPLGDLAAKVEDLDNKTDQLRERLLSAMGQLEREENHGKAELRLKKQKDRTEQLTPGPDQEVALLTDKLSSSRNNNAILCVNLELLQKRAESQASLHQRQITELVSALSIHKDKVCCMEQQLVQARSQAEEAQRGRHRSLQQAEDLESQLGQLMLEKRRAREDWAQEKEQNVGLGITVEQLSKELEQRSLVVQQLDTLVQTVKQDCKTQTEALRSGEQQQWELQEEVRALRGQLEAARDQLHRAGEEEARLQALLEQRAQERRNTQTLLEETAEELQLRQQEAQQGRVRLEEALDQVQTLRAGAEMLRLKLDDRERVVEFLRLQMENGAQITAQHGCTIDSLHQEKSHLSKQLNQLMQEIQQLKVRRRKAATLTESSTNLRLAPSFLPSAVQADLDRHQSSSAALQQERQQLQNSLAQQRNLVQEGKEEKQQLSTQLEVQRLQLLTLTKEHKELQRLHSSKNEEHEGVVVKLRSRLNHTHAELDQARSTLRTLTDRHGLQVAMGMQKQITARREQIDSLQGRIQHLEETVEKLSQEKRYQNLESRRQARELSSVREEKRQLVMELEDLRSKEKQQKGRVSELEAVLHKMSESFANCQDFIQLQEQEFVRLKLQHALDLKELQGQRLCTAGSVAPSTLVSPSSLPAPPPSSHQASNTLIKERPTLELRSLVKELRGVISDNRGPHTDNAASGTSSLRRRSAPERAYETTFSPQLLRTTELNRNNITNNYFSDET
ncbi:coiled-coil domain-containing protein 158-like [Diretmus argenteus]